jgi:hypothetical protein
VTTVDLSAREVMEAAEVRTGLADFGDDYFVEPLQRLVTELNASVYRDRERALQAERARMIGLLADRLQVHDYLHRYPEILNQPIARPVIIVGRQRTGTSKLLSVMGCDPFWNTMPFWLVSHIVPVEWPPGPGPDPRIELGRSSAEDWNVSNGGAAFHEFHNDEPEMEAMLLHGNFMNQSPARFSPDHQAWCLEADYRPAYRYLASQLQFVQWQQGWDPQRRWILKTPPYLLTLPALAQVFPDCTMVMTHRHPKDSVPSLLRGCEQALAATGQIVDRQAFLDGWLHNQQVAMARYMAFRDGPDGERFVDVGYSKLVDHAAGCARRIYQANGVPFTDDNVRRIEKWERDHPQHRAGVWRYSLEEFGLTEASINEMFGEYIDRYGHLF